jgi:phosphatidylserine/phosphatidylglycerophosphate/cardiolipin synthase-like enzyme
MINPLLAVPPHLRERLACALEAGLLQGTPSTASLQSVVGNTEDAECVARALAEFVRLGVGGPVAANWLRTLNMERAGTPQTDLVWTGPEVPGLHARDTRRVYEELLGSAEHTLWVSTYAFFEGPKAFEVLARRMEAAPGIKVTLLLNIQRKRGDTAAADHLVRGFADRFWRIEWPGSARPRVFYDPRALDLQRPTGVLHAKAVVADDQTVFVTSANLTEAGWDRNIELGLLVRDRALAGSVVTNFRGLIDRALLRALPAE